MAQLITLNNIDPSALTTISGPKVTAIAYSGNDTATAVSGGQTITLTGAGFQNGATVYVDGTAVSVVTVVSSTVISFTAPARSAGGYPLYVVNADGGTATFPPGIQYSGTPTWATNSGSLGTVYETQAIDIALSAVSDSAVTYTVSTGVLPAGTTLDANTGNISGTANLVNASTTYNFAVDAVDAENQDTRRNFSVTVDPDQVTFNTPADGTTYTNLTGDVFSLTLNAISIMGKTVSYSANVLPAGLNIVGSAVTGTFSAAATTASQITATAADTLKTATRLLNWAVTEPPPAGATALWIISPENNAKVFRLEFASDTTIPSQRGSLSVAINTSSAVGNDTNAWAGAGSRTNSTIQRITYASDTATGTPRGNLSNPSMEGGSAGNLTNGYFAGGLDVSTVTASIERITYASDTATSLYRGSLSVARRTAAGMTDGNPYGSTFGWFGGGNVSGSEFYSTVDRITFATDTTIVTRGSLSRTTGFNQASTSTQNHGRVAGGWTFGASSTVDRITYATDTNVSSVRGPLSNGRYGGRAAGGSANFGWFTSGTQIPASSNIDRIDYASDTNTATVRSALTASNYAAGVSGFI